MHLPTWVCEHVSVAPGARVLEVGCGPAPYLQHISATVDGVAPFGCDLSFGMASEVHVASVAVGDVQALPFAARSFDVVIAPHMLYHVPDIAAARELARVAGSQVAIVTNTRGHTEELLQLLQASARDVLGRRLVLRARTFERFLFEDAPVLLDGALVVEHAGAAVGVIEVPSVEPVVDDLTACARSTSTTSPAPTGLPYSRPRVRALPASSPPRALGRHTSTSASSCADLRSTRVVHGISRCGTAPSPVRRRDGRVRRARRRSDA